MTQEEVKLLRLQEEALELQREETMYDVYEKRPGGEKVRMYRVYPTDMTPIFSVLTKPFIVPVT